MGNEEAFVLMLSAQGMAIVLAALVEFDTSILKPDERAGVERVIEHIRAGLEEGLPGRKETDDA